MYSLLRSALFQLDAEKAHDLSLKTLSKANTCPSALKALHKLWGQHVPNAPVELMGLKFPNPLGLAAGLDKHATAGNAFAAMGFGWVEFGTVTPLPQSGNAKPRIFRLPEHQAIINRMGFNSVGLDVFLDNIKHCQPELIKGINIGKNAATPIAQATDDYLKGLRAVYLAADYITLNISSPNTKNLRELQNDDSLDELLSSVSAEREQLAHQHGVYRPLVLKVAPDLYDEQIKVISDLLVRHKIDGLAATNTTLSRTEVEGHKHADEAGGLSGLPVKNRSLEVVKAFRQRLQGEVPIMGIGGISSGQDAVDKMDAGADLLQSYTGFIYQGPALIRDVVQTLVCSKAKR